MPAALEPFRRRQHARSCYLSRSQLHSESISGVEIGSWQRHAGLTYAAEDVPPCCHNMDHTPPPDLGHMAMIPWCGSDYRRAQGGRDSSPYFNGRLTTLARLGGYGCTCRSFSDDLEWHPRGCQLERWNATRFCKLLGGRNLLFAGDSTMGQLAVTVMNMVHWGHGVNATTNAGCQTKLVFGASDTLVRRSFGRLNRGWHWRTLEARARSSIVVMSMGPHIHIDPKLNMTASEERRYVNSSLTSVLEEIAKEHEQSNSDRILIWKTQPAAGCGATPLPSETDMRRVRDSQTDYNWGRFGYMDEIAKNFWAGRPRAYVLDLSPLNYRVEAHPGSPGANGTGLHGVGDCLHSCDGPLRLGATLLLNLLAHIQRKSATVPPTEEYNTS